MNDTVQTCRIAHGQSWTDYESGRAFQGFTLKAYGNKLCLLVAQSVLKARKADYGPEVLLIDLS